METIIGTSIETTVALLERNEVVAIPTETVYGLAANALQPEAVAKIFEAKGRPHFNPLIVHAQSWDAAMSYCIDVPEIAHLLASKFSPGPLTFLLKKKKSIPDLVTAGSDLVAIRIPDHPIALNLLSRLNFPLAAPSANQFGYISPTAANHVMDSLKGRIKYILDGGNTTIGLESTIIGFGQEGNVILYRVGGITIEDIETLIGKKVVRATNDEHQKPKSAGQLKSHYAPDTALYIGNINDLHQQYIGGKIGLISLSNSYPELKFAQRFLLSPSNNLTEAAQNLFSFLRQIDQLKLDVILVEPMPNKGLGIAINDRLNRAQAIYKKNTL